MSITRLASDENEVKNGPIRDLKKIAIDLVNHEFSPIVLVIESNDCSIMLQYQFLMI